ncbi:MAG TPA: hypothetical protein PLG52_09035 [Anaerolineales bacterium]|nr:hypothetical protein [Anaerolineales bacterium]HND48891.1 hypothetical protein [Anaerolineales bacterium]
MQNTSYQLRFLPLLVLAMLVNILAQAVHETGHRLVYQVMGHEPVWAFTKVVQMSDTTPSRPDEWTMKTYPDGATNWLKVSSLPNGNIEEVIAAAAGPLLGFLSAILGLAMSRRSTKATAKQAWLTYTISIALVAVLYYLRAPIRTGGDEHNIAVSVGVAKAIVEIPFALGYLACLILGLRELPTWKIRFTWLGTILLGSVATGLPMVLLDPIIIAGVDAGNAWFQPVIGYSLPVFITIILTFIGVWVWSRRQTGTSK